MERISVSRQNLDEFLKMPFGTPHNQKNLQYESRYRDYRKNNKIQVAGTTVVDETYFIHIKVPSESQKGLSEYDVVVQFFTHNEKVKREVTLKHYYVQFYSNSPGFVYKYAALYQIQGYLISSLLGKFTPGMLNTLPEKANKDFELFYDSSIYYACRYLLEHSNNTMGKFNFRIFKTKPPEIFFAGIQDVEEAGISRDVASIEKSLLHEIDAEKKLTLRQEKELVTKNALFRPGIKAKRERTLSTFKDENKRSIIKTAKKSTSGTISSIHKVAKKTAKKSTKKLEGR